MSEAAWVIIIVVSLVVSSPVWLPVLYFVSMLVIAAVLCVIVGAGALIVVAVSAVSEAYKTMQGL